MSRVHSRPQERSSIPTETEVDDAAKAMFALRWGDAKLWRGRRTNRAYYRRRARADLVRALTETGRMEP